MTEFTMTDSSQKAQLEKLAHKRVLKLMSNVYDFSPYEEDKLQWAKMQVAACERVSTLLGRGITYWNAVSTALCDTLLAYPVTDGYEPGQGGFHG